MIRTLGALLLVPVILGAADLSDYAGAEACRQCHAAEFKLQSTGGHAHTLARSTGNQPGDWAFGSGTQAITFVSRVDRESYREHGETWYRSLNGYGVTPGQQDAKGVEFRLFDPAARILRCFACHSTGPLTLGAEDQVAPHELGVRCEVCHGPAAAHVRAPAQNHPRNPGKLSAVEMNTMCAKCHHITLDTGEESKDLRDPRNARSQPLRLAASACFQQSRGRLTCTTCHSPHAPLEQDAAAYNSRCQSCHPTVRHSTPVAGQACTSCHMPAIPQGYLAFANHRIAIYKSGDPLLPVNAKRP